jgi:hypothetical protein
MSEGVRRFPTAKSLAVEDLLEIYDGIIDSTDKVLEESQIAGRLPMPGMPDGLNEYVRWTSHGDPLPPDDITEVTDLVLGKMFSFFQNWTNYVSAEATRAKAARDVQDRHLKVIKSALNIHYREEKKIVVGMLDDYVNVDSRYVEVDAALLRIKVFYETARDRYDQLKRTLNNISREQTRRKEELERLTHDERGGRVPDGKGHAPRRFR